MMIILFIFFFINNSQSSEWNCTMNINENKFFLFSNNHIFEQCAITIEYISFEEEKKQICITNTLSITNLPSFSYSLNYTMKTFKINSCQLLTLNQLSFVLPSSIEILDLSNNLLSTFIFTFPLISNLKYLRLDHNPNLIDINFGNNFLQKKLIGLSLRHNKHIQLSSLPIHLTQLDLTDCNLLQSSILNSLKSLTKLTHLSLANNQLERLPLINEKIQLEYLNVSNNRLIFIEDEWLHKQLHILDIKFNHIQSLEFFKNRFKIISNINQTVRNNHVTNDHILQLSLHGNPLICDCWLDVMLNSSLSFINITDLHLLKCNSRQVINMSRDNLLCTYSRHCASDCSCCDFEACDCHSVCPSECLCSYNVPWTHHIVKCTKSNLSNIHILLPETVTELNYEENNIEQIKSFVFIGKTLLIKLNLAKNNIKILTNETFCGAFNLQELNLSQNSNLIKILPIINDLFGCLKYLQYIILSKEQINEKEQISDGWMIDSYNNKNKNLIRLKRITQQSSVFPSNSTLQSILTSTNIYSSLESETQPITIFSIYQQELFTSPTIIQYNQTLIIIVFFLLLFVLLFLILLITLALCRRKLRRHLTTELQRQRAHHYYHHHHHHTNLQQPSIKIPDNNGIIGTNDSLYEQLPSLSSDSEQPFLYNENKLNNTNAPALPPYPPRFCCHSTNSHEYQYTTNTSTTTAYSTLPSQQCTVLVCANQLRYPNHHNCSSQHLAEFQQCLLSKQKEQTMENNVICYCNNETIFLPTNICRCNNDHRQNTDTYIYPHVYR